MSKGLNRCLPGTVQIECISDSVTDDPYINTSSRIVVPEIRFAGRHLLVVAREATHKDSGVTAGDRFEREPCRLETLVGDFEHLSLLRIQPHGFDWSHAEEGGIKVGQVAIEEVTA